jgi:hypothetical protein
MRERLAEVGDLTAGMWEKRVSLIPTFTALKLKDPVLDDRVLVKPSRVRSWYEEEQRAWRERARATGWNLGKSRRPPKS